ncbi:hypothetical protein, partial [Paenibacillus sp.]|uniref:hypothetical protein n=1 Tax=Paenibacillus sp. TaxID=58172 RepID=UPI00356650E8
DITSLATELGTCRVFSLNAIVHVIADNTNVPKSQALTLELSQIYLQQLSDTNKNWYFGYEQWLNNHPKRYTENSKTQMCNNAIRLLASFPKTNPDNLSVTDIEEFIGGADRAASNNNKVNFTKNFFIYLVESGAKLSFSPDDLNGYLFKNNEIKGDSKEEKRPLTISEIILIRNVFKTDYVRLFVFEMVYQYGFNLDELHQCIEKNYDFENRTFHIKGRNYPVKVSERIHQIIVKNARILRPVNRQENQDRLSVIGKKLQELGLMNRIVRWKDVEETRNNNFFKCPGCGDIYENTPDNWAIIQYESDENGTKWIVCKNTCAKGAKHE